MINSKITLPFHLKLMLIIWNWFVLLGILFLSFHFALISFDTIPEFRNELIIRITCFVTMVLIGIYQSVKKIEIIESADTFCRGSFISKIQPISISKKLRGNIIFKISFQVIGSCESVKKDFYLIDPKSSQGDYDFKIIYNSVTPREAVLFNSLPKQVKKYIVKWVESEQS